MPFVSSSLEDTIPSLATLRWPASNAFTPSTSIATFVTGVSGLIYSNNNRTAQASGGDEKQARITNTQSTGKWYLELTSNITDGSYSVADIFFGFAESFSSFPGAAGTNGFGTAVTRNLSSFNDLAGGTAFSGSLPNYTIPGVFMFAIDFDAKKAWLGQGGIWLNSGDPVAGTGDVRSGWTGSPLLRPAIRLIYSGIIVTISESPSYRPTGFTVFQ